MSAKQSKVAGGAVGAATTVAAIGGDYATKKGNEALGGALSGAAMGASLGSVAGPWGTAIGAVVGGVAGGILGAKKRKERLLMEKEQKTGIDKYNKEVDAINKKRLTQADDLDRYENILRSVQNKSYENGGKISYKRSGLLRYSSLDINQGLDYINRLKVEKKKNGGKLENTPIIKAEKFQQGGAVVDKKEQILAAVKEGLEKGMSREDIAKKLGISVEVVQKAISILNPGNARKVQENAAQTRTFKKGGKTTMCKKGGKCGCDKCKAAGLTLLFRRGGVVDLKKQNVIVDGPSHDDFNNTGVKGDKGLPVVMNGKKIAEIESEELVINATSSKQIEALKAKAKNGDEKAKEELGALLLKELHSNTYDYSELTKD